MLNTKESSQNKHILILLFITLLINMMGFSMIIPIKPQLIMEVIKGDLSIAVKWGGYLLFAYALGQFLMSPLIATLSSRYGRRPILIFSLIASAIDFVVMAVAQHIELFLLARFFLGVFSATIATVNLCLIDISTPQKRAVNFSIISSALGLGLMVGPILGGTIGTLLGIRGPLFIGAILFLINLLLVYFLVPETVKELDKRKLNWRNLIPFGVFKQLKYSDLPLPFLLASFLYQLSFHSFTSIWSFYMIAKFNWSFMEIGWSLLAVGLSNFLVQNFLARILIPKLGEKKTFLLGVFFMLMR